MASYVILFALAFATIARVDSSKFIYEDLVKFVKASANPDVFPQTSKDPVKLKLDLSLINIKEVNLDTNDVGLEAWLSYSWNSGLSFDPHRFNNLSMVRLHSSDIWLPDIAAYNGELFLPENDLINIVVISSDGNAVWIPPVKIRVPCNVTDDSLVTGTTCQIKMGSWTHSSQSMYLKSEPSLDLANYQSESQYDILDCSAKKETKLYACCVERYETIVFSLTFVKK